MKMAGVLMKKQPKAMLWGKWKERYWELKVDKFKYYENEESKEHLGVIDFNKVQASAFLIPEDEGAFKITMNGSTKELIFKAADLETSKQWVAKLEAWIEKSRGKHLGLSLSNHKFWKDEHIDISEFKTLADNGDILLFKSRTVGTKLQRVITRSNYDHVGMVVLCETNNDINTIFLLEAVCDEGVRLVEFVPNIDAYYEAYDKIAYRPLQNMERDQDMLEKLDEYLEEVLGKTYSISFKKMWRKSMNLKNVNGKYTEDVKRTFQCAELVAKMYKVLGILGEDEHSGKFVPANFTNRRKIDLKKGEFGPEWVILPNKK